MKRRVVFLTGTRADFGKIKPLIEVLDLDVNFDVHIFVTGMHMNPTFGLTVHEVENYKHGTIYKYITQSEGGRMDRSTAFTLLGFSDYCHLINPDLIVVHGDRSEALAGALTGALNNILVAHIEGGEISGTVDESIRHSVSKLAHIHFVSNEDSRLRLIQLGEEPSLIYTIGSPDIDIMMSELPPLEEALNHYNIPFSSYSILAYHPVTTLETTQIAIESQAIAQAVETSGHQFVAIYPNSDQGYQVILSEFSKKFRDNKFVKLLPSIRFEYMLTLLKHANYILGNSSMGIHEAPIYQIPTINIGTRQIGRSKNHYIINADATLPSLLEAMDRAARLKGCLPKITEFGDGKSRKRFLSILRSPQFWATPVQKRFCEIPSLVESINGSDL